MSPKPHHFARIDFVPSNGTSYVIEKKKFSDEIKGEPTS